MPRLPLAITLSNSLDAMLSTSVIPSAHVWTYSYYHSLSSFPSGKRWTCPNRLSLHPPPPITALRAASMRANPFAANEGRKNQDWALISVHISIWALKFFSAQPHIHEYNGLRCHPMCAGTKDCWKWLNLRPAIVVNFMEGKFSHKIREECAQQIYMLIWSTWNQAFNFTQKISHYPQLPQHTNKQFQSFQNTDITQNDYG